MVTHNGVMITLSNDHVITYLPDPFSPFAFTCGQYIVASLEGLRSSASSQIIPSLQTL